ncbi:phosphocholine-specific phospholipase C [uncultured Herbaspirillum sp.]|uniref:phosphocholine-specific phospholipase C n=1 Tax=uncultured Herbaspirillum sp. TaxID=160236 RepID=UPI002584149C|nr:phospholipase C, phosphocholine-specific [uncultured Herbaspirillum sp.]
MGGHSRRDFLRFSATLAGAASATAMLPASIRKAMAIAPQGRTGSIEDVEHIVVFMQENRSFDHYLGHLSGVRGYNDRFPVTLPNGRPVWFQPRQEDASALIAPFRYDTTDPAMNAQCVGSLSHTWATTHGALNAGRADQWAQQKSNMCMGYHVREDIPFHYALADAFTVCDQYFCSIPGNTHPNRMYLMTGMVDPLGTGGGPLLDNTDYIDNQFSDVKLPPFTWTTYPERLERAGISWQVYQQGTDFDKFSGNYGTNMLASFENFVHAPIGSSLYERGMSTRTVAQLKADVEQGALPQVSWLLPPAVYSEHPDYTPLYGASYLSDILDALTANPEVWSKTVLFVMYDENDGFFDHIVPPQAPTLPGSGKSTVDIALERHVYVTPRQQDQFSADQLPYGLGPRVPMFVVSPWSRGGRVNSQVFDHTSVLQFIERRFGVKEPNISPWRRAVCGDLSSTLDFTRRDPSPPRLPDTRHYVADADQQCRRPVAISAPALDAALSITPQEPGLRPTCALPYALHVTGWLDAQGYTLTLDNVGTQGAHFWVYTDAQGAHAAAAAPRGYTVEAGKQLRDRWALSAEGHYHLSVWGPNGYFRRFVGQVAAGSLAEPDLRTHYDAAAGVLTVTLLNPGTMPLTATVSDLAYGQPARTVQVLPGQSVSSRWALAASHHWYDLQWRIAEAPHWLRRLAGHLETGHPSMSDPAATAPVTTAI